MRNCPHIALMGAEAKGRRATGGLGGGWPWKGQAVGGASPARLVEQLSRKAPERPMRSDPVVSLTESSGTLGPYGHHVKDIVVTIWHNESLDTVV